MALSLLDNYDTLLVDLDGTIFAGHSAIAGASEGLRGRKAVYITNNASRSPQEVAEHLNSLGFSAHREDVLTSAQAVCAMAHEELTAGKEGFSPKVYILGAESFVELAREAGMTPVHSADDCPDAVLHGHSPHTCWKQLSEAALAIHNGAQYFASNLDSTLPSERGFLVGNGSMVAAIRNATGVTPRSAGKPEPAMFEWAVKKTQCTKPLVIGDRLDTDIAGGIAAGYDTLCVLTGVATHYQLLETPYRPTYIAAHLGEELSGWKAEIQGSTISLFSGERGATDLMAAAALAEIAPLVWGLQDRGEDYRSYPMIPQDEYAAQALEFWRG